MKRSLERIIYRITMLLTFCFLQVALWAQDDGGTTTTSSSKTSVNVSDSSGKDWYMQPWVWIVAAAVFILLLVAIASSGRSSSTTDRVVVKKTIAKDTDGV